MELDLLVVVPDADWEATIDALLSKRRRTLRLRDLRFRVLRHPQRDPGVRRGAHDLLRGQAQRADRALVILDHHGSGFNGTAEELEQELGERLARCGWKDRCRAIVVEPELEAWVWVRSPHVSEVLGWNRSDRLELWLRQQGLWPEGRLKPPDPKRALKAVLRTTGRRASPALFAELGARVSFEGCRDRSFDQLVTVLRGWFGEGEP